MKNCPDGTHCQNEYLIEELEHQLDLCEHVAKTMVELHDQRVGEIYELTAENAALREQVRWIPVSERLPEIGKWVLVWLKTLQEVEYAHRMEDGDWGCKGVTHWMSLPLLPEEQE